MIGNRYRHAPTLGDLLDRRLDVVGRVVAPANDQQVFDAADDEQFAVGNEARVSRLQPWALGRAVRRGDEPSPEGAFGLGGLVPVADGHVVAVNPDLADRSLRALGAGVGIDDAHRRRLGYLVIDQRCTALACAPLGLPGGQFVGVELDDRGWFASSARRRVHRCLRKSIRGPQHRFLQIEASKPVAEALEGCRLYPLATAEDGQNAAEVEPGEVVVRNFARCQLKGEVGCRRERPCTADRLTSGGHQLEPPRRSL